MKGQPNRPASLLAVLCGAALAAALAVPPSPAHAGKVVARIATKGNVAAPRRTIPEAAQQSWGRRAFSAKAGGQGILPGPHAGGVHGVAAAGTGVAARLYGASPRVGTGPPVRGAAPAIIHPTAKTGARASGTGSAARGR
jgi:hypothetical protein